MDAATLDRQRAGPLEDELVAVVRWRFGQLARAGFELDDAIVIACHPEIDLHEAVDLVCRGCPSRAALRILL